jgi:hypothetical protein
MASAASEDPIAGVLDPETLGVGEVEEETEDGFNKLEEVIALL